MDYKRFRATPASLMIPIGILMGIALVARLIGGEETMSIYQTTIFISGMLATAWAGLIWGRDSVATTLEKEAAGDK